MGIVKTICPIFIAAIGATSLPAAEPKAESSSGLDRSAANEMAPQVKVTPLRGVPSLVIDRVLQSGMVRAGWNTADFPEFHKVGVRIFSPITTATAGFWESPVWVAPDTWDYGHVDEILKKIASGMPDAWILLRVELSAPAWWRERHASETVKLRDANGQILPLLLPHAYPGGHRTVPSWSSQLWRTDTAHALARLVRHIEASPYGHRVIGYQICSGESHEWFEWGNAVDWSDCNVQAFRQWLNTRYQSPEALHVAWNSPAITFTNALPPTEERVGKAQLGWLRDPQVEQQIVDYQEFVSARTGDAVDFLCRAVKNAASHPVMVGAFYGYLLCSDPRWGHQNLDQILDSPSVDFLASPGLYWEHRHLGVAAPGPMVPLSSLQLHGKYWLNETDLRTSVTPATAAQTEAKVLSVEEDVIRQRRELAWILCSGVGQWWFDVCNIRYDTPPLMAEIGRLNRVAETATNISRAPEDRAAAVIDPGSAYYLLPGTPMLNELRRLQVDLMIRSGMASGCYSSRDLPRLKDKKLILFCDAIAPSPAVRDAINTLKSEGRVLVFVWAAGAVSHGIFSAKSMENLTGIRIRALLEGATERVTVNDCGGRASQLKGLKYGSKRRTIPLFIPDDPAAEVWGTLDSGRPALVVKKHRDWTAVYSSSPRLPPEVLALLGDHAGVHRYIPAGDALWASEGMLGITTFTAGIKRLCFDKPVRLYDLYEGRTMGTKSCFEIPFEPNETRLFSK